MNRQITPEEKRFLLLKQPIRWHFDDGDRVFIRGIECKFVEYSDNGYIFAHCNDDKSTDDKRTFPVSLTEMEELEKGHRFKYAHRGHSLQQSRKMLRTGITRMRDLPKDEADLIRWKVDLIKRFDRLRRSGLASWYEPSAKNAIDNIIPAQMEKEARARKRGGQKKKATFELPGPTALRKWTRILFENNMDPMSLRLDYCNSGNHKPRYDADEFAILYKFVLKYMSLEKPSIAMLHRDMGVAIRKINKQRRKKRQPDLQVPGEDTLADQIRLLPAFDVMAGREGEEVAINYFRSVDNGPPGVTRAMQRVEMDAWVVHLYALAIRCELWDHLSEKVREKAKRVRMLLTMAMCCASRVYVGLSLTPTVDAKSSLKVLRMMFMDKTAMARAAGAVTPWEYRGTPELVVFDGGPENANDEVTTALTDLGIIFEVPKGEAPGARGRIERGFHTTDQKLISRFSGRAMKNPAVRKKYQALARACVTVEELAQIIVRYFADDYHNAPHSGLNRQAPRGRWLQLTKRRGVIRSPSADELRVVFGEEMKATLEPKGIRCLGNWYRSAQVQHLFETRDSAEVTIRYDREDLGWISLQVGTGWLTVPGPKDMRGLSVEHWMVAGADVQRRHANEANLAKDARQEAIAAAIELDEQTRKRSGILDTPVTREQLDRFHRRMSAGVEYADDVDAPDKDEPGDLFDDMTEVGTKPAKPRKRVPQRPAAPRPNTTAKKPKRKSRKAKPAVQPAAPVPFRRRHGVRTAWRIKEPT